MLRLSGWYSWQGVDVDSAIGQDGYMYIAIESGDERVHTHLGTTQIDQLIAHLIEVRGASRVQELLNKPEYT
jgi:hypothetical protein